MESMVMRRDNVVVESVTDVQDFICVARCSLLNGGKEAGIWLLDIPII